jgi:hypothetical protein
MAIRWIGVTVSVILVGIMGLVNTTLAASKPDWISGKSPKYPAGLYLTGVGYGADRKSAEDAAYAAIARIFEAEIASKTQEWEKYAQTDTRGKSSSARDIQIDQMTSVVTHKVLEDVSIADVWVSDAEKQTYALAVMDRDHALTSLKEKIRGMDQDIGQLRNRALELTDPIEKARTLRQALKTLLSREVYQTDYRIINPSGEGIESPVALISLRQQLQDVLAKEVRIGVVVEGPHGDRIRSTILEGLTKEGFVVESGEDRTHLNLLIQAKAGFENADLPQWKFVRWTITADLIDQSTGKVFGSFERHGREGHLNFTEAEAKALQMLQKDITDNLSRLMISSLFGESSP